jgi:Flp pilus assembly protein TadG
MHLRRRWDELCRDERGSGALEFIVGGLVLLVPIVYLIVALGTIQAHTLGVEQASRHISRSVATAEGTDAADARADRVLAELIDEYGIDPDAIAVDLACVGSHTACPEPGATIRVTVTTRVALPLVPPVLGLDDLARVGVEASAVQKVSRYWSEP